MTMTWNTRAPRSASMCAAVAVVLTLALPAGAADAGGSTAPIGLPELTQPVGSTELISRLANGRTPGRRSGSPSISADGRFIVFHSRVRHFIAGRTCAGYEVYLWDRKTGLITLVSHAPRGRGGNDLSIYPVISADGQRITYFSRASNLVRGDTNGVTDIFIYNVASQTTE